MTCEDALILLSGHLDGVNTQEEETELFAHLQSCAGCRDLLAAFEAADAGIQALEAEPPAGLSERILAAVRQEPRRQKRVRPWLAPVATAAVLALVCWAGIRTLPMLGSQTANTALTQTARAEMTTADTTVAETPSEENCTADAAMPEAYTEADAASYGSDMDAAANCAEADLDAVAAALRTEETAAVLVLDEDAPVLAAYEQTFLPEGVYRVQLPQEEWEALEAAYPDAAVYLPDAEPAVYYVLHP